MSRSTRCIGSRGVSKTISKYPGTVFKDGTAVTVILIKLLSKCFVCSWNSGTRKFNPKHVHQEQPLLELWPLLRVIIVLAETSQIKATICTTNHRPKTQNQFHKGQGLRQQVSIRKDWHHKASNTLDILHWRKAANLLIQEDIQQSNKTFGQINAVNFNVDLYRAS